MGLFDRNKKTESINNKATGIADTQLEAFNAMLRQYPASTNPTYLSIVNAIASTVSTLDYGIYQRNASGSYRAWGHPYSTLLKYPNPEDTLTTFLYRGVHSYFDWANVYLYKVKGIDGNYSSLPILDASKVQVTRYSQPPFHKIYTYGGVDYTDAEILHIYNPANYDGIRGKSVFEYAKQLIDLDTSLLLYIQTYFSNSLGKRVYFEFPNSYVDGLKDDDKKKAFLSWIKSQMDATGLPDKLPEGTKIQTIDLSPNSETDIRSLKEATERAICNLVGNFPYYKLSGDYGNNLQNQQIAYYQQTILPITDIFAEAFGKLLNTKDSPFMEFRFSYENLLKPDMATLNTYVANAVRSSIITPNEGRKMLGLDSIADPEADKLQKIANLIPFDAPSAQQMPEQIANP